jgi:hypothetical protein
MLFQNLKAIGEEQLSEICVLFCKYIYIFIYIDVQICCHLTSDISVMCRYVVTTQAIYQ